MPSCLRSTLRGALAGPGVDVISLASTTTWEQKTGTSFANPLVANMATLLKQKCGGTIGPRYLRAILMAGSWYFDPENSSEGGLAYSTQPKPGTPIDLDLPGQINTGFAPYGKDYKDGAGGPAGNNVLGWCNVSQTGLPRRVPFTRSATTRPTSRRPGRRCTRSAPTPAFVPYSPRTSARPSLLACNNEVFSCSRSRPKCA